MNIFVFDVESDGLYGEGFAFGAVVMDPRGNELAALQACCLEGVQEKWVQENVLPHLQDMPQVSSRALVRQLFWDFYMQWKDKCRIFGDVIYPVEAEFMRRCVLDHRAVWDGPFPLLDVSAVMLACGYDPLTDGMLFTQISGQAHHPLFDARVSAHKLLRLIDEKKLVL